MLLFFFFFFQAEDGIRDRDVTGVQTCALPISTKLFRNSAAADGTAVALPGFRSSSQLKHTTTTRDACARPGSSAFSRLGRTYLRKRPHRPSSVRTLPPTSRTMACCEYHRLTHPVGATRSPWNTSPASKSGLRPELTTLEVFAVPSRPTTNTAGRSRSDAFPTARESARRARAVAIVVSSSSPPT